VRNSPLSQVGNSGYLTTISTERLDTGSGTVAAAELAALPAAERPTAIFAANDLLAIGLLQGLVTHGVRVPEQISLIGYDDIEFAAAAAVPLSSIRHGMRWGCGLPNFSSPRSRPWTTTLHMSTSTSSSLPIWWCAGPLRESRKGLVAGDPYQ
jgi:hypothetical protein